MTVEKSGGAALVECLLEQGVDATFGVPGESYLDVLNALYDVRNRLKFTICRNEGGAAFMAAAYGKLTGQPGIAFVTRGPGATNASIGVHTAMQDSSPMILFVGQVGTGMKGREAFQEIDYRAYFGSLAKWVTEIDDVERIPEIVSRAFSTALSGRPGPVVVALPEDMLVMRTSKPAGKRVKVSEPAPSPDAVARVRKMLNDARQPLILIGGGGWSEAARDDLQQFAEANNLPVAVAFRFHDLIDNASPSFIGDTGVGMTPAVKKMITDADTILALGIRFGEMVADGYTLMQVPDAAQRLIHVHISDGELGKIYQADLPVHAGVNTFLAAFKDEKFSNREVWRDWTYRARNAFEDLAQCPAQPGELDMGEVVREMQRVLPADAILTNGAGNFSIWTNKFFCFGRHMRLLAPQSGSMGYGLPAAIAAKIAQPQRSVVCIAGDGDFQMNMQELGSAMQAGAQPVVLIINNGMYGTIRMHQEKTYPERISGTEIVNPDFVALAKAYGYHAERVEKTQDFAAAFGRALASNTGAVLELIVDPEILTPRLTVTQAREQGQM